MDIEIPKRLYELLLQKAAEADIPIEEIVEQAIKNFLKERKDDDHAGR